MTRVAAAYGVHYSTVRRRLRLHGLSVIPKWSHRTQADWDRALAPYSTLAEADAAMGKSPGFHSRTLKVLGMEHPFRYRRRRLEDMDTDDLALMYEACEHRTYRMAGMLGVHILTLQKELHRRGIEVFVFRPSMEGVWKGPK